MDLHARCRRGEPPAGSWVALPDPATVETVAGEGFDFLVVDTEHTPATFETVEHCVRAVEATDGPEAFVRVAWHDHVRIKRALDTGVTGLMAPRVDTASAARDLVAATRYPPEGDRGVAAARASGYGRDLDEYYDRAGDELTVLAQVETETGLSNAGDIAAVDGVDALFVGPADLSAGLGTFGDYDAPEFDAAVEGVLADADAADTPVGTLATSPAEIERWRELGFDFLIVGTDVGYLRSGAAESLAAYDATR
ncbi:MAG: HpcH/HpaI aldolase/citrate lyase family protein [Halolamina sp.]